MSINKAFSELQQGGGWGGKRGFVGPIWGSHGKTPTAGESAARPAEPGPSLAVYYNKK